jgi:hypothetical protein
MAQHVQITLATPIAFKAAADKCFGKQSSLLSFNYYVCNGVYVGEFTAKSPK